MALTFALTSSFFAIPVSAADGAWHIQDSITGGDCTLIGTWYAESKTCLITQNFQGRIVIESNGVTLDGDGHMLEISNNALGDSIGVTILRVDGVVVKNLRITAQPAHYPYSYHVTGIYVLEAVGAKILENNIILRPDTGMGISLYDSNAADIVKNFIADGQFGIRTMAPYLIGGNNTYNLIKDNTITRNHFGVYVGWWATYAYKTVITKNVISNNDYGVEIGENARQSEIYNNDFIDNGAQVRMKAAINDNIFYLAAPIGGNYWSNYNVADEGCNDANNDNFCDSPYVFAGGADNLPLTKPINLSGSLMEGYQVTATLVDNQGNIIKGDTNDYWYSFWLTDTSLTPEQKPFAFNKGIYYDSGQDGFINFEDVKDGSYQLDIWNYENAWGLVPNPASSLSTMIDVVVNGTDVDLGNIIIPQSMPTSITLIYPNGGEELELGETYAIQWQSQNLPSGYDINIEILSAANIPYVFSDHIANLPNNSTSVDWTVPQNLPPGEYMMRIIYITHDG
ncbi:MAG: NosD domain-containing protein, partial [Candidatus Subteraquimicrobiales bacterium]|nr:NosD domain-containing protein [Candidatus Subteraquimicrobiales bacterium]